MRADGVKLTVNVPSIAAGQRRMVGCCDQSARCPPRRTMPLSYLDGMPLKYTGTVRVARVGCRGQA